MTKTGFKNLLLSTLPLAMAVGCANNRPEAAGVYSSLPPEALTPTSAAQTSRVYSNDDNRPGTIAPQNAPPQGSSPEDWSLAERIRGTLIADKTLAPYPSEVTAIVDKQSKGVVTLKGTVINGRERQRLQDSVSQVPGVTRVDDQLVVATSEHGAANLKELPK